MNKALRSDLNRALSGKGFCAGMAGMVLAIALASLNKLAELFDNNSLLNNGFHIQLISEALKSDGVSLIVPVLCTLPFACAYVDDIKSGFIKACLYRSGVGAYIWGKLMACGLAGGLTLFAGIHTAYFLSVLGLIPMELAPGPGETAAYTYWMLLDVSIRFFFTGMVWALLGFTLAALAMSRLMALVSPFITCCLLIILKERYFDNMLVLYPKEWLFPSGEWVLGGFGVVLVLTELITVLCLCFALAAQRRLSHV